MGVDELGLWAAERNWEDSVEVETEAAGMGLAAVEEDTVMGAEEGKEAVAEEEDTLVEAEEEGTVTAAAEVSGRGTYH